MSERDGECCILPPPLPDPPGVGRTGATHTLAARTAHFVAREAVRAFDEGDRERLLAALDALVELAAASDCGDP
jgi:hypothetical protein